MRSAKDLIDLTEPAFPLVQKWVSAATRPVVILPPAMDREAILEEVQVTTRSPMGAIVYETGGILVDGGWIRILGSGHPSLTRPLSKWNAGRSDGYFLVADDAVGGFFAINGGALGPDAKHIYYFAPDALEWEPLAIGYSDFIQWILSGDVDGFYEWIRWSGWADDVRTLGGDQTFAFYPFLWSEEGKGGIGQRAQVPVEEAWSVQMDFRVQLGGRTGAS